MNNNLGKIIKQGRRKKELTQDELAKKMNVTKVSIWAWESGKSIPDGDTLIRLAQELDIVEELFSRKRKKCSEKSSFDEFNSRLSELEKTVSIFMNITQNNNHQSHGTVINNG